MRVMTAVLVACALAVLPGCSLFGGGGDDEVPSDPTWRERAIEAIEGTPGVSASSVKVNDVDDGGGHKGPVITGGVTIEGDAQQVVDAMMRRLSDVLGEQSSGVRLSIRVMTGPGQGERLDSYGYPGITNGKALYDAVHG